MAQSSSSTATKCGTVGSVKALAKAGDGAKPYMFDSERREVGKLFRSVGTTRGSLVEEN
jgi:hypothetical protein